MRPGCSRYHWVILNEQPNSGITRRIHGAMDLPQLPPHHCTSDVTVACRSPKPCSVGSNPAALRHPQCGVEQHGSSSAKLVCLCRLGRHHSDLPIKGQARSASAMLIVVVMMRHGGHGIRQLVGCAYVRRNYLRIHCALCALRMRSFMRQRYVTTLFPIGEMMNDFGLVRFNRFVNRVTTAENSAKSM